MSDPRWKANVTVAAVICHDNTFLMVEEHTSDGLRINQPAGHLDFGESLPDACVRETREETSLVTTVEHLIGIYHWDPKPEGPTSYIRFAFAAQVDEQCRRDIGRTIYSSTEAQSAGPDALCRDLDKGISRAVWMTLEELEASTHRHRSPIVLACVRDFLSGFRYPPAIISRHE